MPRGLGAREAQEDREWSTQTSYRQRTRQPAFVLSGPETARYRLDGVELEPQTPVRGASVTGAEARTAYAELVARAGSTPPFRPVASSSAVILDGPAASVRRHGKGRALQGRTKEDAIDLESSEDDEEIEPVVPQHCIYCQSNVPQREWAEHMRSLPHLLASDMSSATLLPHIAIKESNVGRTMLTAQGWRAGDGLGAKNTGRLTPLTASQKQDRLGIGLKRKKGDPVKPLKEVKLHESGKERSKRLKEEKAQWNALYSYIKEDMNI